MQKQLQEALRGNGWVVMILVAGVIGATLLTGALSLPTY